MSVEQPIASPPPSLFAGVEPLEVFVELLADIDMHTSPTEFYDRICEAICRLTTMRRAAIFMADAARRRVRAIGSYGIPFEQLSPIRPTLLNTPIAQRALLEDKVVVVSERIEEEVPPEYAQLLGITTLVCTPLSAGGYAYGVICADRGGGRFELSDGERHLLWTLGKTAALVAAARNVTRQQERMRRLGERLDLAREIHESVLQRLFGVSLVLGAEHPLDRDERDRCRIEMQEALADLRRALERPLAPLPPETGTTLAAELDRVRRSPGMVVEVDWHGESSVPADVEPLAQSVLAEALRNIAKHADPTRVEVAVSRDEDDFVLEVRNDGARRGRRRTGDGAAPGAVRGASAGRDGGVRAARRRSLAGPPGRAVAAGHGVMEDSRLRVLVVDDHDVVHWGFRVLLGEQPWVERFFQARTGAEALALASTHKPHVALVDLFLAGESGAELSAALREASPATRVLLISGAGRMSPAAARAAGASGFVSKDWDAARVAAAVRRVGLGMTAFPPKAEQPAPMLTEREREVLDLIAGGSTNREIAERLYLSPHTVKEHTSVLYRKLRARNRAEAVQRAQRIGLLG